LAHIQFRLLVVHRYPINLSGKIANKMAGRRLWPPATTCFQT
jgi:hypothetical protein